ncbi:MAG TPA: hypothetical protein VF067_07095 [Sphingomicrobium sp.]
MGKPIAILLLTLLSACASGNAPPSLLPRAAEAIDPRIAIVRPMNDRPADTGLAGRLSELVNEARSSDAAFQPAVAEAQRLAETAGAAQTESWIVAEQALTRAIATRDRTVHALSDIDAIGGSRLQANGGLAPNDLEAIKRAGAEVGAIDERQAQTIKAIQNRLAH